MNPESPESDSTPFQYVGSELELFQNATNWKRYFASRIHPLLGQNVLEVGAGLGANLPWLAITKPQRWVSIEPDPELCQQFRESQKQGAIPQWCEVRQGTIQDLPAEDRFDTILYIDVLEHIEDDQEEFERAYERLTPGGHLIILCPAHQFLFSRFDQSIGHFRRYNKSMFRAVSPHRPKRLEYLDSIGMFASLANRVLLRQSMPTGRQIAVWDKSMVPISRFVDPLIFRSLGKTILGVWQKANG